MLGKGTIKGLVKASVKIIKWTNMLVAQCISLMILAITFLMIAKRVIINIMERFIGYSRYILIEIFYNFRVIVKFLYSTIKQF